MSWQMESPNPLPCAFSFSFSKRWKIAACLSLGMPQPVSVTERATLVPTVFKFQGNAALRCKFGGVNQQVYQDLLQARVVRFYFHAFQLRREVYFCLGLFNLTDGIGYIPADADDIIPANAELYFPEFKARQVYHIVDEL